MVAPTVRPLPALSWAAREKRRRCFTFKLPSIWSRRRMLLIFSLENICCPSGQGGGGRRLYFDLIFLSKRFVVFLDKEETAKRSKFPSQNVCLSIWWARRSYFQRQRANPGLPTGFHFPWKRECYMNIWPTPRKKNMVRNEWLSITKLERGGGGFRILVGEPKVQVLDIFHSNRRDPFLSRQHN